MLGDRFATGYKQGQQAMLAALISNAELDIVVLIDRRAYLLRHRQAAEARWYGAALATMQRVRDGYKEAYKRLTGADYAN